jgi:hypothetical protein
MSVDRYVVVANYKSEGGQSALFIVHFGSVDWTLFRRKKRPRHLRLLHQMARSQSTVGQRPQGRLLGSAAIFYDRTPGVETAP